VPPPPSLVAATWRPRFVSAVAAGTGIPELVVWAWLYAENGPSGNPLNIGPGRDYGSPDAAARAVVDLLHSNPAYAPILRAAKSGDDRAVLDAITRSPWDAGHYRGGALLRGTYKRAESEHGGGGGGGIDLNAGLLENLGIDPLAPVERATSSIEEWVQRKALLSLVYVGLTGAALVLILAGLNAATGASGIARGYLGARAARGAGDVIPF
jgi:hypothetical protein